MSDGHWSVRSVTTSQFQCHLPHERLSQRDWRLRLRETHRAQRWDCGGKWQVRDCSDYDIQAVRFGLKVGQIWPKNGTNLWLFQITFPYILAHSAKMYWNLIWKSPGFDPFEVNLTHFGLNLTSLSTSFLVLWTRMSEFHQGCLIGYILDKLNLWSKEIIWPVNSVSLIKKRLQFIIYFYLEPA